MVRNGVGVGVAEFTSWLELSNAAGSICTFVTTNKLPSHCTLNSRSDKPHDRGNRLESDRLDSNTRSLRCDAKISLPLIKVKVASQV